MIEAFSLLQESPIHRPAEPTLTVNSTLPEFAQERPPGRQQTCRVGKFCVTDFSTLTENTLQAKIFRRSIWSSVTVSAC